MTRIFSRNRDERRNRSPAPVWDRLQDATGQKPSGEKTGETTHAWPEGRGVRRCCILRNRRTGEAAVGVVAQVRRLSSPPCRACAQLWSLTRRPPPHGTRPLPGCGAGGTRRPCRRSLDVATQQAWQGCPPTRTLPDAGEPKLFHLAVQGRTMNPQPGRGRGEVTLRVGQRVDDHLTLCVSQRAVRWESR